MRVVCTAGHVDHGKSTLVRALTGMEPDRLAEEQRRGLTIDLGFVWTDLTVPGRAAPTTVAFVDLPGHERFVATMLSGAGAVDVALFVVAADEGWMPQSAEHLAILDLLGVRAGVVALTKADTVDAETAALAADEVREQLAGTTLRDAAIVAVSAARGSGAAADASGNRDDPSGLGRLTAVLLAVLDAAPPSVDRGRPRLWVDRSFSVRGAGTVVTGTLHGGRIAVGDELAVLPGRRATRVRGLQSLRLPVAEAAPGSRVAVNLSGLERGAVGRGDALGRAEQWASVRVVDTEVRVLPGGAVGRRGAWHLHTGSGERLAEVVPLLAAPVTGEGFVRLQLGRALALTAGDRFVLREAGRRATLGGGRVLDASPPPRPRGAVARAARADQLAARSKALDADDRTALLRLHVDERGAAELAATAAAVGLTLAEATAAARAHRLLALSTSVVAPGAAARWAAAVAGTLTAHHAAHPLERVAARDVALRAAEADGCPRALAAPFLDALVKLGRVHQETGRTGTGVRTPEHRVSLDAGQAAARDALLRALGEHPFAPPALSAATTRAGAPPALVRELEAEGAIVRLGPDLAVGADALAAAVARLRAAATVEGPLSAARAKEVLGTSRKYALPLLEELDRRGLTRRRGDVRDVLG